MTVRKKTALEKIVALEKENEILTTKNNTLSVQYEKLLTDYRVCYAALENSQARIKELSAEREEGAKETEELREGNIRLREENEKLRKEVKDLSPVQSAPVVPAEAQPVSAVETAAEMTTPTPAVSKAKIELNPLEKYGAEAIGQVVVEATRVIGTLAQKGSHNAKDTLSLALGRTEVFKSEVLAVLQDANLSEDDKKSAIDHIREQAIEYLASVAAQE